MSAIKDPSTQLTFNYLNFYQLYRNGKLQVEQEKNLAKGIVVKTMSLSQEGTHPLTRWANADSKAQAKNEMAHTLKDIRDAKKRLQFLMGEIDELLKRDE